MIRYININNQILEDSNMFSWYDTIVDRYLEFNYEQVWETWEEFYLAYNQEPGSKYKLERFAGLIPKNQINHKRRGCDKV